MVHLKSSRVTSQLENPHDSHNPEDLEKLKLRFCVRISFVDSCVKVSEKLGPINTKLYIFHYKYFLPLAFCGFQPSLNINGSLRALNIV